MPCKQKSFELVIEGIFETFLHLPALDSVLRWHFEALIVTFISKYWVVFSLQLHSRTDLCIYLFLTLETFSLWLLPAAECLPGLLTLILWLNWFSCHQPVLPAHIHQTKWLHFFLLQILAFMDQISLCKVTGRQGLNSSHRGFYFDFTSIKRNWWYQHPKTKGFHKWPSYATRTIPYSYTFCLFWYLWGKWAESLIWISSFWCKLWKFLTSVFLLSFCLLWGFLSEKIAVLSLLTPALVYFFHQGDIIADYAEHK